MLRRGVTREDSVRIPASFCNLTGLKPTYGRVGRSGVISMCWSLDHVGFMTRTVRDAALLLEVSQGLDDRDSSTLGSPHPKKYVFTDEPSLEGLKIGIFVNPIRDSDEGVTVRFRESVNVFSELGQARGCHAARCRTRDAHNLCNSAARGGRISRGLASHKKGDVRQSPARVRAIRAYSPRHPVSEGSTREDDHHAKSSEEIERSRRPTRSHKSFGRPWNRIRTQFESAEKSIQRSRCSRRTHIRSIFSDCQLSRSRRDSATECRLECRL